MTKFANGYTETYALLGSPISHSISPEMYNYTFDTNKENKVYVALDTDKSNIETVFNSIRSFNGGFSGGNVTMPIKGMAAELVDELTEEARLIGAVNTFKVVDHKIIGHNTDGKGFIDNLHTHQFDIKNKKVVLVGVGGAATAIAVQAAIDGVGEISIFNIKDDFYTNGETLVKRLSQSFPDQVFTMNDLGNQDLYREKIQQADLLVNATSVGMAPRIDNSIVRDVSMFHKDLVVTDTVYEPVETKLLKDAKEAGVKQTIVGTGMTLHQGAAAYEFFTGNKMPVEAVNRDVYQNQ